MRIIQISFVAIIFLFLTPYFLLIGPDKLRDYLYRELVYKVVIENIILESDTDLEKSLKIQEWVHKNEYPFSQFGLIDESALTDFVRGIGYCDMLAKGVINLAKKVDIAGRVTGLYGYDSISHHSIAELKINNEYRIFDPYYNIIFRNKKNNIATFDDLQDKNIIETVHGEKFNDRAIRYREFLGENNNEYYRLFEPKYPSRIMAITSPISNLKKLLSFMVDKNYEIFGDYFLKSFEALYFKIDKSDPLLIARYKHLTFRFEDSINDYTTLIELYPDLNSSAFSTFWDTFIYQTPGIDTYMYFRAKAYWDIQDWANCSLNFKKIFMEHPYTKWNRPVRLFLDDCNKRLAEYR